jgi:predicted amidophosphoribosyltransferase
VKCIPGKSSRTYCLKCHSQGRVIGYKSPMVDMQCQTCGATWRTISAICPSCHNPSGRPYMEDCQMCQSKKKQQKQSTEESLQMTMDL